MTSLLIKYHWQLPSYHTGLELLWAIKSKKKYIFKQEDRGKKIKINDVKKLYCPVQDCCDSPSLSPSPPSSGAALPLSPQSVESTRGQQTATYESARHKLFWVLTLSCYQRTHDLISKLTFSASDKTVLAWMMATCSSFLKFYTKRKKKTWINNVPVLASYVDDLNSTWITPLSPRISRSLMRSGMHTSCKENRMSNQELFVF